MSVNVEMRLSFGVWVWPGAFHAQSKGRGYWEILRQPAGVLKLKRLSQLVGRVHGLLKDPRPRTNPLLQRTRPPHRHHPPQHHNVCQHNVLGQHLGQLRRQRLGSHPSSWGSGRSEHDDVFIWPSSPDNTRTADSNPWGSGGSGGWGGWNRSSSSDNEASPRNDYERDNSSEVFDDPPSTCQDMVQDTYRGNGYDFLTPSELSALDLDRQDAGDQERHSSTSSNGSFGDLAVTLPTDVLWESADHSEGSHGWRSSSESSQSECMWGNSEHSEGS
ncbi:uncharacterized protein LOC143283816 [Babylonia areolata]|uniref:uncharacterized protein LOC143283816 n=1 Tax=Babylonia areolata TaxID=304850 RepID=UPI003FCEF89F